MSTFNPFRTMFLSACMAACWIPAYGWAQTQADSTALEEVIVTATKTGVSNLQNTPMSITAVSGDELERSGIGDLKAISVLAPGITISQNNSYGQLYIRGIGTNNIFPGGDPSSTMYLDGVYLSRPYSVFTDFLELERIEVLRGPQGTLYGRNSTGGTVNLITRKPDGEWYGKGVVELGSYQKRRVSGLLNGSLGSETLSGNLAFNITRRDGYIDNQNASGADEFNDEDRRSLRTALRFIPNDALTVDLAADYFERDESSPQYKPQGVAAEGKLFAGAPNPIADFWTISTPLVPTLEERGKGLTATANWRINDGVTLASISAYREVESEALFDSDYSEMNLLISGSDEQQHQTSQEFQYTYRDSTLTWVSGLYFYDETVSGVSTINILGSSLVNSIGSDVDVRASALYSNIQWQLTDALAVLIGARYSYEEKTYRGAIELQAPLPLSRHPSEGKSWNDFSPKLGLNYHPCDNVMLYGNVTQGFKSGGFNFTDGKQFDPEEIISYELGFKSELTDRLRINGAAFYYDYRDLQVQAFVEAGSAIEITNAANAKVTGLELELLAHITEQWRTSVALTQLNARYEDYTGRRAPNTADIDLSDNKLNSAPEFTAAFVTDYAHALAGGRLLYRLEYAWQDKIYFTAFNDDLTSQGTYGLLNASVSFSSDGDNWQVQCYGKNLTDRQYSHSALDFPPNGVAININPPRTFGLKGIYYFR